MKADIHGGFSRLPRKACWAAVLITTVALGAYSAMARTPTPAGKDRRPASASHKTGDTRNDAAAEPWEKLIDYSRSAGQCKEFLGTACHQSCLRYAATLIPAVAAKGIDCLRKAMAHASKDSQACTDPCTQTTCTNEAFEGVRGQGDRRCQQKVRAAVRRDTSDATYIEEMVKQCEDYTSGMNGSGRDRFIACVLANASMGYRICLWDASVAPCGHDEHHRERPLDNVLDSDFTK